VNTSVVNSTVTPKIMLKSGCLGKAIFFVDRDLSKDFSPEIIQ